MKFQSFEASHRINYEGLIRNLRRQGTPDRVYHIELFQDREIEDAVDRQCGVTAHLDRADPWYESRRAIAMQRFLGYDFVGLGILSLPTGQWMQSSDTTDADQSKGNRNWIPEDKGLITSWEDFEKYPWPDGKTWDTRGLEWLDKNLPEDMCILGRGGHFCEYLCWLMGYETLCYALYEQRDLVEAIAKRVLDLETAAARVMLQSKRLRIWWASDDLGFATGLMISPDDTRKLVLSGHKELAKLAHAAGCPYLLHACGKRSDIIEDMITDTQIDAVHSWEDKIESIIDAKRSYGDRMSLLGGIDVDFLCRADEAAIRRRVRDTVAACQPGGGFCLGSGNTVANYIPLQNYLTMLDEGRRMA